MAKNIGHQVPVQNGNRHMQNEPKRSRYLITHDSTETIRSPKTEIVDDLDAWVTANPRCFVMYVCRL